MTNKDLEQYINRLKTGDKSAFTPIYEATYKNVYFMCYSVVKNPASAEDLTQETYIRMYEKILSYENGTNFNAWLIQIAKNLSLNYLKKYSKESLIDINSEEYRNSIEDESQDPSKQSDVLGLAKKVLTDEEFQILTYIVVNGLKRREVSVILDMPIGTVTWKYERAIKKIKDELEK